MITRMQRNRGFTIIEIVLVLAVAGLIFLIVFLALPSLQRERRNTQRKSDAARLLAQLENYQANNARPPISSSDVNNFVNGYIKSEEYNDPKTGPYDIQGLSDDTYNGHQYYPNVGQIYFKARHVCVDNPGGPGTDMIQHADKTYFSVVVWTQLENGIIYCIDNGDG